MTRERRQWSKDQKLQIIQEVEVNGLQPTLRKYHLSQSLFYKRKRRFNEQGMTGLDAQYPKVDPEKRKMEQEIKRLRELVGELSLELWFKDELLKKTGLKTGCHASDRVIRRPVARCEAIKMERY